MTAPSIHTIADYESFVLLLDACLPGVLVSVETWRTEFDDAGISGAKRGGMFTKAAREGRLTPAGWTHAKTAASKGGVRLQYVVVGVAA